MFSLKTIAILSVCTVTTFLGGVICWENITETHPTLNLKSYKLFAKNRTVFQNETHFRLPRVFDELVFECNSNYPTKWNYYSEQVAAKDVEINKWRLHGLQENATQKGKYYSTFKVVLRNPNKMINLSCENICPRSYPNTSCRHLNSYLKHTVNSHTRGFFNLEYALGNRTYRRKLQDAQRGVSVSAKLGWNKECKYSLHVDLEAGTFACMLADGTGEEVPSMFVPCNNPDECDTVFKTGDDCSSTFQPSCTDEICSELRDTSTLFVLACGEYNESSIARAFFKTLDDVQSGGKQLHEYKRKDMPFEEMVQLRPLIWKDVKEDSARSRYVRDRTLIYTKYKRHYECRALRSFFTCGIRWIIRYKNGTELDLGTGTESTDVEAQVYVSKKTIEFNSSLVTSIICEVPNWNEIESTNATLNVTVLESFAPYFIDLTAPKNATKVEKKVVNLTSTHQPQTLTCPRNGQPPAKIQWHFDGIRPEDNEANGTFEQDYILNDTMSDKSEVILQPNHPFREVYCLASNKAGKAKLYFKLKQNTEMVRSIDVPVVSGVVIFALLLIMAVILSSMYKIRKTRQGAYLSDGDIEEFFAGTTTGHDAFMLPYDKKLEISRESFTTDNVLLGSGTYGKVVKGNIGFLDVAIKITKSSSESLSYLKALLSEVKIMSYVGNHPNIVNLIAVCTMNLHRNELQVILEFCERGDLLSLLKRSKDKFINMFEIAEAKSDEKSPVVSELVTSNMILSSRHLLHWTVDIIEAMEFISRKNIIHGDLAARNVLITHDLKAKISDFGLSKHMYSNTVYVKTSLVPLPTRWMAYESLKNLEFSVHSDIWSFGVTIWEMFTLGEIPFDKYMWEFQSHALLAEGIRLEKPLYASNEIYGVMLQTWNIVPDERPSFSRLKEIFNAHLSTVE